jgi:hypothetical protein
LPKGYLQSKQQIIHFLQAESGVPGAAKTTWFSNTGAQFRNCPSYDQNPAVVAEVASAIACFRREAKLFDSLRRISG